MTFPDDLPHMLEYRVGCTVRTALPRRPVQSISSSGQDDAALVCPQIPYGATAWRRATEETWHPMRELPEAWLPFLNRERPSPMDFRPALEVRT